MASPAVPAAFTPEAARESLIAISESVPEIAAASPVKPPNTELANGKHDGGAERYRLKLISISYSQSPDAQPMPCPPKNIAT